MSKKLSIILSIILFVVLCVLILCERRWPEGGSVLLRGLACIG